MANILVTGSNGQLGSDLQSLSLQNSDLTFTFHDVDTLDITDYQSLVHFFDKQQFDYIVNCAAYTAVDKAENEPDKAQLINATAAGYLAKIAKQFNIKLIHISTDYVFDGTSHIPYNEDVAPNPIGVYAKTKFDGEKQILQVGCDFIIIRASWLYSSFGNNFVKTILRLAKERESLGIVFDQIGTPTYSLDLADYIVKIIQKSEKDNNFQTGIYHFSNEGVCSWYDFAIEIVRYAGLNCVINPIETKDYPTPTKRPAYSVLNKSKIKNTFIFGIPHWRESMEKCLDKILK